MNLLVLIIFYLFVQLCMGKHDPSYRLSLMILLPALIYWAINKKEKLKIETQRYKTLIVALIILLSFLRTVQIVYKLSKPDPRVEDIALVYEKSIKIFFNDLSNPYSKDIDPYPFHYKGDASYFDGPKYPPLQIITYAPLVLLFGIKGIYLTNLIVFLCFIFLFYRYFKKEKLHLLTIFFILSTEFVFNKLFSKGVNDLLPAMLAFMACLNISQHPTKSGILLGLSFLAKQLPAGLVGLWFLSWRSWRAFFISAVIVIGGLFPFILFSPIPIWENLVLFNLLRPVRETSLLLFVAPTIQQFLGLLGPLLAIYFGHRKQLLLSVIIFILCSKMSPGNYFIWAWPFLLFCVLKGECSFKANNRQKKIH